MEVGVEVCGCLMEVAVRRLVQSRIVEVGESRFVESRFDGG